MEEKYPPFVKYERIPHLDEVPHILDRDVFVFEKLDGMFRLENIKGEFLPEIDLII